MRQQHLGRVDDVEVESAFRKTVPAGGAAIDDEALAAAVEVIDGFPYMMQLVGYWTWEESAGKLIGGADVCWGIAMARRDFRDGVLAATYCELSKGDLRFLAAMVSGDGDEATLGDIARRMDVKSNYASKYKARLMEAGVIEDRGQNHLRISLPGFREYFQERLGSDGEE